MFQSLQAEKLSSGCLIWFKATKTMTMKIFKESLEKYLIPKSHV